MSTRKQKAAARKNIQRARRTQSARAHGVRIPKRSPGLSTRQQNRMAATQFAFPKLRKEPLNDARHVRNAIARFDQVEGVSNRERSAAWRRIRAAARKHGVAVNEKRWRDLMLQSIFWKDFCLSVDSPKISKKIPILGEHFT